MSKLNAETGQVETKWISIKTLGEVQEYGCGTHLVTKRDIGGITSMQARVCIAFSFHSEESAIAVGRAYEIYIEHEQSSIEPRLSAIECVQYPKLSRLVEEPEGAAPWIVALVFVDIRLSLPSFLIACDALRNKTTDQTTSRIAAVHERTIESRGVVDTETAWAILQGCVTALLLEEERLVEQDLRLAFPFRLFFEKEQEVLRAVPVFLTFDEEADEVVPLKMAGQIVVCGALDGALLSVFTKGTPSKRRSSLSSKDVFANFSTSRLYHLLQSITVRDEIKPRDICVVVCMEVLLGAKVEAAFSEGGASLSVLPRLKALLRDELGTSRSSDALSFLQYLWTEGRVAPAEVVADRLQKEYSVASAAARVTSLLNRRKFPQLSVESHPLPPTPKARNAWDAEGEETALPESVRRRRASLVTDIRRSDTLVRDRSVAFLDENARRRPTSAESKSSPSNKRNPMIRAHSNFLLSRSIIESPKPPKSHQNSPRPLSRSGLDSGPVAAPKPPLTPKRSSSSRTLKLDDRGSRLVAKLEPVVNEAIATMSGASLLREEDLSAVAAVLNSICGETDVDVLSSIARAGVFARVICPLLESELWRQRDVGPLLLSAVSILLKRVPYKDKVALLHNGVFCNSVKIASFICNISSDHLYYFSLLAGWLRTSLGAILLFPRAGPSDDGTESDGIESLLHLTFSDLSLLEASLRVCHSSILTSDTAESLKQRLEVAMEWVETACLVLVPPSQYSERIMALLGHEKHPSWDKGTYYDYSVLVCQSPLIGRLLDVVELLHSVLGDELGEVQRLSFQEVFITLMLSISGTLVKEWKAAIYEDGESAKKKEGNVSLRQWYDDILKRLMTPPIFEYVRSVFAVWSIEGNEVLLSRTIALAYWIHEFAKEHPRLQANGAPLRSTIFVQRGWTKFLALATAAATSSIWKITAQIFRASAGLAQEDPLQLFFDVTEERRLFWKAAFSACLDVMTRRGVPLFVLRPLSALLRTTRRILSDAHLSSLVDVQHFSAAAVIAASLLNDIETPQKQVMASSDEHALLALSNVCWIGTQSGFSLSIWMAEESLQSIVSFINRTFTQMSEEKMTGDEIQRRQLFLSSFWRSVVQFFEVVGGVVSDCLMVIFSPPQLALLRTPQSSVRDLGRQVGRDSPLLSDTMADRQAIEKALITSPWVEDYLSTCASLMIDPRLRTLMELALNEGSAVNRMFAQRVMVCLSRVSAIPSGKTSHVVVPSVLNCRNRVAQGSGVFLPWLFGAVVKSEKAGDKTTSAALLELSLVLLERGRRGEEYLRSLSHKLDPEDVFRVVSVSIEGGSIEDSHVQQALSVLFHEVLRLRQTAQSSKIVASAAIEAAFSCRLFDHLCNLIQRLPQNLEECSQACLLALTVLWRLVQLASERQRFRFAGLITAGGKASGLEGLRQVFVRCNERRDVAGSQLSVDRAGERLLKVSMKLITFIAEDDNVRTHLRDQGFVESLSFAVLQFTAAAEDQVPSETSSHRSSSDEDKLVEFVSTSLSLLTSLCPPTDGNMLKKLARCRGIELVLQVVRTFHESPLCIGESCTVLSNLSYDSGARSEGVERGIVPLLCSILEEKWTDDSVYHCAVVALRRFVLKEKAGKKAFRDYVSVPEKGETVRKRMFLLSDDGDEIVRTSASKLLKA